MTKIAPPAAAKSTPRRVVRLLVVGFLGTFLVALVLVAALQYPGRRLLFLLFVIAFSGMLLLALPRPRLYVYTFLALFLFLGFCSKTVVYFSLRIPLVEPTGAFDGSGRAWDAALVPAIVGSVAIALIRLVHLGVDRAGLTPRPPRNAVEGTAPGWYGRFRIPALISTVAAVISLHTLNVFAAFYQIGVTPRLVLPGHLNVVTAWLLTTGFPIWIATLLGWEAQLSSNPLGSVWLIPFGEAVAAVSTLSRAAYLFRALPYLLVAADFTEFFRARVSRRWRALILIGLPVGFVLSLAAVALLRIVAYPGPAVPPPVAVSQPMQGDQPSGQTGSNSGTGVPPNSGLTARIALDRRLGWAAYETSTLIVGRWIGIEGTMAASSYPALGPNLLGRGLREKPAAGESSLYQGIAGSTYSTNAKYVFLTTPGAIAVLYYSGSLAVVFLGMALLAGLLSLFEMLTSYLVANTFVVSIIAISLAIGVTQMHFPYLFFVLVLEQFVAVIALAVIWRRSFGANRTRSESAAVLLAE